MKNCYIEEDLELFAYAPSQPDHNFTKIKFETFNFAGGEVHIKLLDKPSAQMVVNCRIRKSDDLMRFALVVDALRAGGTKEIEAFVPYIPYARQDDRMVAGEPLSIRVFADILNSLKLDSVIYYDAHSVATSALINSGRHHHNFDEVKEFMSRHLIGGGEDVIMVSPDGGAYKKIFKMCKHIGFKGEIINASKVRDLNTGNILATKVEGDVSGKNCLVVDDICDGGKTFVELGKALKEKGANELYLFVSHGIFSKGLDELSSYFKVIGTTNSFRQDYAESVKVISIKY